ncbi:flagellar hook-basal body complex protein [Varunaivibrio sulfuroxidans]|uniref:Flagellar hook protein FlgE n=1 Tax=Varunaivibrio sulfuroxidans TaxID=1773489 RepID=A0A4R3JDE6_9PROT|nr:flagellar hook-basal body complex protein [Varunaivibrio sulfuroxidans]TCS64059.1 flagellar hook protein FlgE [Varunaivibrio sulfuroxidans]WES31490.1 flagellar hook-basal body complex protein [Varunaivibrio sulfuroxidans]
MISNIFSSAVSGLQLNAQRVGAAADNIANANTAGYKAVRLEAKTVTTRQSPTAYAPGGVQSAPRTQASIQGLLQATPDATDLALSGPGYFTVARAGAGGLGYTRSGAFSLAADGTLKNVSGQTLLGYPLDGAGKPTSDTPAPVHVGGRGLDARATENLALSANLPANAPNGQSHDVNVQLTDSQGNALNATLNFKQEGANTYRLSIGAISDGVSGGAVSTAQLGGAGGGAYTVGVHFNADGALAGFDTTGDGAVDTTSAPNLFATSLSTGGADLNVALNLGKSGGLNGLTQFAGNFQIGAISADGGKPAAARGVLVASDGTVSAQYANGDSRPLYRVAVATFANPSGLEAQTGNVYIATQASGAPLARTAGQGGAGTIAGGALEASNVDIARQFVDLIVAETAYTANVKTIQAAGDITRSLLNVRA